ncbi:DUF1156 domain-containing protein [Natronorubrum sulfidifaciens]|uniref:DUF1156 domain-containing protein n=1 Tax=Natronorubrum sulfidifaciens TaxID=388259 RepID=UPI000A0414F5|nr:DUF1156 domain-containing protein [Natronorubrum sulfidifaciens]
MTSNNRIDPEDHDFKPLAIEGSLPLKAVGIENLKEGNPKHMPPHRYLHPWFARRPTPVSRLAILSSILPRDTKSNELLEWMQIGPKEDIGDISEYVEKKKATEGERNGTLGEHYGYPRPFTASPNETELKELHGRIREHWDGELPSVLDPTAGGGVIPFESIRYGFPTKANELNPVPSLLLKVLLESAPEVGSLNGTIQKWVNRTRERAQDNLAEYYPNKSEGQSIDSSVCTYVIECPTCGSDIPLVPKWWVRNPNGSGTSVVAFPSFSDNGSVEFDCLIDPTEEELGNFDPSEGTVSRGGNAECLNCDVVIESDEVRKKIVGGNFEYSVYGIKYRNNDGTPGYRAPTAADQKALKKAEKRVKEDYEIATLLSTPIPEGKKTREPLNYGMSEWRDLFSPRQLVAHYEYLQAVRDLETEIREKHDDKEADTILTLLAFSASKMVDYNCRLASWHMTWAYPNPASKGNNFAFNRVFVDNNMSIGEMGHEMHAEKVIESYEELVSYLHGEVGPAELTNNDAADLPYSDGTVQSIVIDPPYYSSVMYAELSDFFYVWEREYLKDVYPNFFSDKLTNKEDEAVANSERFDNVAGGDSSKKELANEHYENKMADIFSELYRVLEPGGVMTVMFTHKETDAWDTLTKSLIKSGFTITSTHPITSEMPIRAGMRQSASADSTLILVGRKPIEDESTDADIPCLWNDVKTDTRTTAKEAARNLLKSGLTLTKTDVIISAFGPTLRVFADAYPVVDDEDNEVPPRRALEEAREAVTQVLVDEYLEAEGIDELDDVTEWYILCWLVHESETFSYDEGHQLGLGIGVDIDDIKRSTKTWRKSRGDISLRSHDDRVQNINEKPEDRSSRIPVNPDDLSFSLALDKVHAAMHVYDVQGESACCDWLRERNFDTDSTFKATLKALLQVLPHDHDDWELARDLAAGRTRDVLDLDFSPNVFADDGDETTQTTLGDH